MWRVWRPIFRWDALCPIRFADPFGFLVVMPRAQQPVTVAEVVSLHDATHPDITAESKVEDHGRIGEAVVVLDYGYFDRDMVQTRRTYYAQMAATQYRG